MPDIKPITPGGVAAALQKAHRYRVLNDSVAAESICLDVLAVDPEHTEAIVTYLLAITDQFPSGRAEDLKRAGLAAVRLQDPYKHAYYNGIICERWSKSILERAIPRAHEMAYGWIDKALGWYAKAEQLRAPGNDEAILRWNTCVRMLQRDANLTPREAEAYEPSFE